MIRKRKKRSKQTLKFAADRLGLQELTLRNFTKKRIHLLGSMGLIEIKKVISSNRLLILDMDAFCRYVEVFINTKEPTYWKEEE